MKSLSLAAVVIATSATAIAQQRFSPTHPEPMVKPTPVKTAPMPQKRQGNVNHPLVGANDSCTTPATAVDGPNAWDNTGATLDGPQPCGAIGSDVWYTYTATGTGSSTASFCGGTGTDTVLAIYNVATCPTLGNLIICNDDTCNFQSQVQWSTTMGTTYMIQAGGFSGSQGTGTLTISPPAPPAPNDDCANPIVLVGSGPFPFNSTGATTGVQGQGESLCNFFGFTQIATDVWYTWNATVSGPVAIDLCAPPTTAVDTKMAVYAGAGCPSGSALACNDDSCGLLSKVTVNVTMGQDYTIQLGNYPGGGGATGTGTITFTPQVVYPGCRLDDGTSEDSVGIDAAGFGVLWMNKFGSAGESNVITTVSATYGNSAFPGFCPPNGTPTLAGIWNDPTNDGDPSDAVLLATAPSTVQNGDLDIFNDITFSPPVVTSGVYFVGVGLVEPPSGHFPASLDESQASGGRSWVVGNNTGQCNYSSLSSNSIPPLDEDNVVPGVWLIRADCAAKGSMDTFCFGDGTGLPCPCGNNATVAGNGCANSDHVTGAQLSAAGTASLGADSVTLVATGHHLSTLAVLFQGSLVSPLLYGDGVRCIGGSLKRPFKMTPANAGTLVIPGPGSTPPSPATLSSQSAAKGDPLSPGAIRGYQLVYRDPGAFCTSATFNATNGVRIIWAP